jgi:hypothetical protein
MDTKSTKIQIIQVSIYFLASIQVATILNVVVSESINGTSESENFINTNRITA